MNAGQSLLIGILGGVLGTVLTLTSQKVLLPSSGSNQAKSFPAATTAGNFPAINLMSPNPDEKALSNYKRSGFNNFIMAYGREYSDCYNKLLEKIGEKPKDENDTRSREGVLTYVFQVGEDGSLLKYELIQNEFKDAEIDGCVSKHFADLRFLPPPLGINRYISHDFSFKTKETYEKELEERKNSLPKVLPVSPDQNP